MKAFIALPLLLLTLVFSSCKKETIVREVIPNRTIITDVPTSAWQFDDQTQTYFAAIDMPEIDGRVHDTNGVLVYISADGGVYEAIPNVFNGSSYVYSHEVGTLYLEVQGSDGSTINPPSATIRVKIVIVESEPV